MTIRRAGVIYRIKTYPSGRRVRVGFIGGRIVSSEPMARIKQTKTRKRLTRKRRRIGLR